MKWVVWFFLFYFLLINIFVLFLVFGGLMYFLGLGVNLDIFVLMLFMICGVEVLVLLVFIGGLLVVIGMVIVEIIVLFIMVCNDLVMLWLLWLIWL